VKKPSVRSSGHFYHASSHHHHHASIPASCQRALLQRADILGRCSCYTSAPTFLGVVTRRDCFRNPRPRMAPLGLQPYHCETPRPAAHYPARRVDSMGGTDQKASICTPYGLGPTCGTLGARLLVSRESWDAAFPYGLPGQGVGRWLGRVLPTGTSQVSCVGTLDKLVLIKVRFADFHFCLA
jgi:hypothetical protein